MRRKAVTLLSLVPAAAIISSVACGGAAASQPQGFAEVATAAGRILVYDVNAAGGLSAATAGSSAATVPPGGLVNIGQIGASAATSAIFAADPSANAVHGFAADMNTGALRPLPGSPYASCASPVALAYAPGTLGLAAACAGDDTVRAYSDSLTTGVPTTAADASAATPGRPVAVARYPTVRFQ